MRQTILEAMDKSNEPTSVEHCQLVIDGYQEIVLDNRISAFGAKALIWRPTKILKPSYPIWEFVVKYSRIRSSSGHSSFDELEDAVDYFNDKII